MDDFDLRMERAAIEGAVSRTQTLVPFVNEAVEAAKRELDATQSEIEAFNAQSAN